MANGIIVKALSGFYYVKSEQEDIVECRARGQFKLKGISPLVGDQVTFEYGANGSGFVLEVHERTNELVRPPIANVDQVLLVFSAREPNPNPQLLDKFLVHTAQANLTTHIIFSKCDLLANVDDDVRQEWDELKRTYTSIGYQVFETSSDDDQSLEPIRSLFDGKTSVLAGQSGVGKSSLLNRISPHLQLQTQEISHKLGRGKHTTRHVELHPFGIDGYIADTPGFSQLDFFGVSIDQLPHYFLEMAELQDGCKFRGCSHLHEPSCAIRDALDNGQIATSRYESYKHFYTEIKEMKRRY
jgi:ribosome biogenesis GTPase